MVTGLIVALASAIGLQRLLELKLARRNFKLLLAQGGREVGRSHYPLFFILHLGWLLAWPLEAFLRGPALSPAWVLWLFVFALAQGLRYWAIRSLGSRWSTRIVVLDGQEPVRKGPYRLLNHPNYLAVALELASAPLVFGAWLTMLLAGLANAGLLLGIRLPKEKRALAKLR